MISLSSFIDYISAQFLLPPRSNHDPAPLLPIYLLAGFDFWLPFPPSALPALPVCLAPAWVLSLCPTPLAHAHSTRFAPATLALAPHVPSLSLPFPPI